MLPIQQLYTTKANPKKIQKIDENVPIRPDSFYGVSKAFGEAIGRYYYETYKIQSINFDHLSLPLDIPGRSISLE